MQEMPDEAQEAELKTVRGQISPEDLERLGSQLSEYSKAIGAVVQSATEAVEAQMHDLSRMFALLNSKPPKTKDVSGGKASSKPNKIAAAKKRHAKKKANKR